MSNQIVRLNAGEGGTFLLTTEIGHLMVCLCDKTCANHVNLIEFLSTRRVSVLIHVKDADGKIVPLAVPPAASPEQPHEAPTPMTDVAEQHVKIIYKDGWQSKSEVSVVSSGFARKLERKLAAAIERERLANMRIDQAEEALAAATDRGAT